MRFPKVIDVKTIEKYKIEVHFNDGFKGVYDLSHLAGKEVFKIWDEDDNFSKVFINKESGAVSWPGEIDLDSLNIYCRIKGISTKTTFSLIRINFKIKNIKTTFHLQGSCFLFII